MSRECTRLVGEAQHGKESEVVATQSVVGVFQGDILGGERVIKIQIRMLLFRQLGPPDI